MPAGLSSPPLHTPAAGGCGWVATIADPRVIGQILAHLGLPLAPPRLPSPRLPAGLAGDAT